MLSTLARKAAMKSFALAQPHSQLFNIQRMSLLAVSSRSFADKSIYDEDPYLKAEKANPHITLAMDE